MTVVVIKSDYMLETLRISKYRKVTIFDRSRQSAGNPLKISGIIEGEVLHKKGEKVIMGKGKRKKRGGK